MRPRLGIAFVTALVSVTPVAAAEPLTEFRPDAVSVQRYGRGYRYPQAGWIVLHAEGEPYERGEQHGRLLAPEIAEYVRCCATQHGPKAPDECWRLMRTMVNALFVRQFEPEYLEEMKGIADGAAAAGAKYDGRPIDLVDIVALNCWPEIDTLDTAVEALPTGLEGKRFPHNQPRRMPPPGEGHCSAFAATGPATADGTVVFGHITMWSLRPSRFFNVWLDVQPAKGHRVLMQSFPGGIQSGMDYYMNSAGLLVTETTIRQTRFDVKGLALAGRIRKALQYADSIDAAVDALKTANNGLYSNEWLLADTKTNEIAMFELGTHASRLYRSSKGEWYGGTEGFYWGCNNTKDLQVRLETIPGVEGRPANMVWKPSDRDQAWQRLYSEHKGKIGADFGRLAFTTAPLAAIHSLDAKYTTSAMTKKMQTWALFGPPLGKTWEPTLEERAKFPNIRPLVSNPWTVLRPDAPASNGTAVAAVDIHDRIKASSSDDDSETHTTPAWHGTILPKSDADAWLAAGFAEYERIVALEIALEQKSAGKLTPADRDRLAVALNGYRARYADAARREVNGSGRDRTERGLPDDEYWKAVGKGVLTLHALRGAVGTDKFCELMDSFGRANAGKEVTAKAFTEHVAKTTGKNLQSLSDPVGVWARPEIQSFESERERTMIIYGTADEEAANRATAELVQEAIRTHWSNQTLPIKADKDATENDLRSHNLLLIGRPDTNRVVEQLRGRCGVTFGWRSFTVRGETYAHAGSAVIASGVSAFNPRYSTVVLAGLSAEATTRAASALYHRDGQGADVLILPHGGKTRGLVAPPEEMEKKSVKSAGR
jgi:Phospholipase B